MNIRRHRLRRVDMINQLPHHGIALVLAIAGIGLAACAPTAVLDIDPATLDGLEERRARGVSALYVRPAVDFASYDSFRPADVQLAFALPDRGQREFPLDEAQRTQLRDAFEAALRDEMAQHPGLPLVDEASSNTLDVAIRVQDVGITVPPRSVSSGMYGGLVLEAVGRGTLVVELRDSTSGALLLRAFDQRSLDGLAQAQGQEMVTRWEGVQELLARWAHQINQSLTELVAAAH